MPFLSVLAVVVFTGYVLYAQVTHKPDLPQQVIESPDIPVFSEPSPSSSESATATATASLSPRPRPTVSISTDKSAIDIKVDMKTNNSSISELIVYPGASSLGGNKFESETDGDAVYDWYYTQLQNRSFNIRNNIKTRANDKFKAVLQGVSNTSSIKITIEKENSASKTKITLE